MVNFMKGVSLFVTWFFMLVSGVCMVLSLIFHQWEGAFWYGIGLVVSSVIFRTIIGWFLRE